MSPRFFRRSMSFRARLTLRWTMAFGLLLALVSGAVYIGIRSFLVRDLDAQLRTLAGTELASAVDTRRVHIHDFPASAFENELYADKFVQLLTPAGDVMMQGGIAEGTPPLLRPDQVRAAETGAAPIFPVRIADRPGRMVALWTEKRGERFVVAVGLFTDRLEATMQRIAWLLAALWAGGLALTALLGAAIASRALAPIGRITQRAAAISHGDFSARLDPPVADDEIGNMVRLLNEMLERLHAAIEANRRFAADASHELRGPLTAMLGELDVTLKRERSSAEYRETLSILRERMHDVVELAHDLMLLVRAQEGHASRIAEVPVIPLLRRAAAQVSPAAAVRGIEIRLEAVPDLVAYADEHLLARVFDNLLRNAVQYNRDGGSVHVTGRLDAGGDGWSTAFAVIEVHDTGAGVADEERERVFERFYRTDRSRSRRTGGTGLGLSICREVMTLFGGTVRVRDSSPAGTTFEMRLPGALASAAVTTDIVSAAPLAS